MAMIIANHARKRRHLVKLGAGHDLHGGLTAKHLCYFSWQALLRLLSQAIPMHPRVRAAALTGVQGSLAARACLYKAATRLTSRSRPLRDCGRVAGRPHTPEWGMRPEREPGSTGRHMSPAPAGCHPLQGSCAMLLSLSHMQTALLL